ncbi:MAG: ribbon-helix-helix protein, CopG family [Nocardioides sp.]
MTKYTDAGDIDLDTEVVILKDGTRLTEEVAEELGREMSAEAAQRRGRGRPSLTGRSANTPHVSARVAPEVRDRLKARAEREGKPVSELVREAIEAFVS